ncbi:MAG: hypothetical protein JJT94_12240 [Bernardetiaceae bacterium]|nr:hypothetical protein [Bernardetiaceae bacterium]
MKFPIFILSLIALFFVFGNSAQAQTLNTKTTASTQLEVIYFHSAHRCKTCNQIEKMTKKVLQENYAEEMKNGKIAFKTYNVDEAANEKIAESYEAAGSALFLNQTKNSKRTDLTSFGFTNAFNETVFTQKLQSYIAEQL